MFSFLVKSVGEDHAGILLNHRMEMLKELVTDWDTLGESFREETRMWIVEGLRNGKMKAFVATTPEGKIAGSGCLLIHEDQPRPGSTRIDNPYLLSMYTEKVYRNQGAATSIVAHCIEWAKSNGYDRVTLHASESGRPVYEKFGFKQTNEMRLWI